MALRGSLPTLVEFLLKPVREGPGVLSRVRQGEGKCLVVPKKELSVMWVFKVGDEHVLFGQGAEISGELAATVGFASSSLRVSPVLFYLAGCPEGRRILRGLFSEEASGISVEVFEDDLVASPLEGGLCGLCFESDFLPVGLQRVSKFLFFVCVEEVGLAEGAGSLCVETQDFPETVENRVCLLIFVVRLDDQRVREVVAQRLGEVGEDFGGQGLDCRVLQESVDGGTGLDHATMEVEEIRVKGKTLSRSVTLVVEKPGVKGEQDFTPQDIAPEGPRVGRSGQQVLQALGRGGVVEILAQPVGLSLALLGQTGLEFEGPQAFGERGLRFFVEVFADIGKQMVMADVMGHARERLLTSEAYGFA